MTSDTPQTAVAPPSSPPAALPVPAAQSVVLVRQALDLSQEQLAELLAVDRRTIARWEASETQPHAVYVAKMLDMLERRPNGL